MKIVKNHAPATPKVRMIETPSQRRAQRQIERALACPFEIEDWDDLDYSTNKTRPRKVPLK